MKNIRLLAGGAVLLLSTLVLAQTASYNGTWRASYKSPRGADRGGTVVVNGEGCPDSVMNMKRVDDKTLEGALDDGRKFTLTRKE